MKLGEVLSGGQGGGGNRNLRTGLLAVLALAAAYGAYTVFGESEPPPAPENAVLPKPRPAAVAQATPPAGAKGKVDPKAKTDPAMKPDAKATGKPDAKAAAKPADAAKTVAVPSQPKTVAKAPAPAPAPAPKPAVPTPAVAKATAPAPAPAAAPKQAATTTQTVATPRQGPSPEAASVMIQREVFSYDPGRRRDPFVSLAKPSEVGPLLGELKLIGIAFDEVGRNSVAVLRDQGKGLYRVKIGQSVGRARVATIGRRSVTFNVDEFGVTRQEVMTLRDTTRKGM